MPSFVLLNQNTTLLFVFEGVCCLCRLGDVCCVFWGWCDVCEDGASDELVDAAGVLCPQGSELCGKEFLLLSEDVGWGLVLGVVWGRSVCWGYIPGHLSCHSIKSASVVTLSIIVLVSYNSGKSLMISYAINSSMTGKSSSVL